MKSALLIIGIILSLTLNLQSQCELELELFEKLCIDQNLTYQWVYRVRITDGISPYNIISGRGSIDTTNNIFTSDRLNSLDRDTLIIEDDNGCRDTLTFVHNCDCGFTIGGTMNTMIEEACIDQCITVKTNNDHGTESDDYVSMILHRDSLHFDSKELIEIQQHDTSGNEFCFNATNGMIADKIYYVSYVVADLGPNGEINIHDPCLKFVSKPIRFNSYAIADAGGDYWICGLAGRLDAKATNGNGQWVMISKPRNAEYLINETNPVSTFSVSLYGEYLLEWSVEKNGCVTKDTVKYRFTDHPNLSNMTFICDSLGRNYKIRFGIINGDYCTYQAIEKSGWVAEKITTHEFITPWIPSGDRVKIEISDMYDCERELIDTSYICIPLAVQNPSSNSAKISPNPAINYIDIINYDLPKGSYKNQIFLTDIEGTIIKAPPISVISGGIRCDIDQLQSGMYFIHIKNEHNGMTYKFIKL